MQPTSGQRFTAARMDGISGRSSPGPPGSWPLSWRSPGRPGNQQRAAVRASGQDQAHVPLVELHPVCEGHGWTAHRPGYPRVWAATLPHLEARLLDVQCGRGPGHWLATAPGTPPRLAMRGVVLMAPLAALASEDGSPMGALTRARSAVQTRLLGSSAGDLAVEANAQRDRVRRAGRQRVLAVHVQADPAPIAQPHINGIPEGPAFELPPTT